MLRDPADLSHLPAPALIVLVGSVASGKSTLARRLWPGAVIDVEGHRRRAAGTIEDEGSWYGFVTAYAEAERRLDHGETVVFDSTAVTGRVRRSLQATAAVSLAPACVVVLDTPAELAAEWNADRPDPVPAATVRGIRSSFERARAAVLREDWHSVTLLTPRQAWRVRR